MRILLVLSLLLIGCKEGATTSVAAGEPAIDCQIVDPLATDIDGGPTDLVVLDVGGQPIGNCIAVQGDYIWVQDSETPRYHYPVNINDGTLREIDALIFEDAACTIAVGHEYNYPLHLSGDVYVFSFEGAFYEYDLGPSDDWVPAGGYWKKTPGGSCDPFVASNDEVRTILPSSFSRTFTGPVSL